MGIACRGWKVGVAALAAIGWIGVLGHVIVDARRPPGSLIAPGWMAGMSLAMSLAVAGSLGLLLLVLLPSLYASWRAGLEYGRDIESLDHERELERSAVAAAERPVLRSVR